MACCCSGGGVCVCGNAYIHIKPPLIYLGARAVRTITWCNRNSYILNGVCSEPGTPQNFEFGLLLSHCYGNGWRVYTLQYYPIRGTNFDGHVKYLDSNEIAKGSSTDCASKTSTFEDSSNCFYAFPTADITLTRDDFVVTLDETDAGTTYKCDVNPEDDPIFPEWIKLSANPLP
jgi:hypothetical protein